MTSSTGKSLGIILIILLVLLIAWPLKFLLFAPSAALSGFFHDWARSFEHFRFDHWPFLGFAGISLFALAFLVLWIAIIVWVYSDAEKRGMSGILWALVVFILHLVGLLIYLLVRSGRPIPASSSSVPTSACSKCGKEVGKEFTFCPHCGERMQPVCPKCAKPVEKSWQVCPHCGEKL
jgi:RNA polymerase subunit RPABC4/transcription elongation factor Spt4/cbb3-type cytochrome oxidase subunit 3